MNKKGGENKKNMVIKNFLHNSSKKNIVMARFHYFLLGVLAANVFYVTLWISNNHKALTNAVKYPEVVANLEVARKFVVKK